MKKQTNIQLLGTPSTTFTYIKHVIGSVIERSQLALNLEEITDIRELLRLNIDVIPTLKVEERLFAFPEGVNTNEILKDAIYYLLKKEGYGKWPVIGLISKGNSNAYFLANDLAKRWNAIVEWWITEEHPTVDPLCKENTSDIFEKILKNSKTDWQGHLFSSPILKYQLAPPPENIHKNLQVFKKSDVVIMDGTLEENEPYLLQCLKSLQIPVIMMDNSSSHTLSSEIDLYTEGATKKKLHPFLLKLSEEKPSRIHFRNIRPRKNSKDKATGGMPHAHAFQFSNQKELRRYFSNGAKETLHRQPVIFLPYTP